MAYSGGVQSDPITINGLFLKHYLDMKMELVKTFESQNINAFNLHVANLRASVMGKERRADIDHAQQVRLEEMETQARKDGVELSQEKRDWQLGFCVVEACSEFLNQAFHITQSDGAALLDMTDGELMREIETWRMVERVQKAYGRDKTRMQTLTARVLSGNIEEMAELEAIMAEQDADQEPV